MGKETQIVAVTSKNFDDFVTLLREFADHVKMGPVPEENVHRLKSDALGDHPRFHALLAKVDEEPAGYAVYFLNYSSFAAKPILYLEDLYVRERFRGDGLGQELFSRCAREARDRGCCRMEWHAERWNEKAHKFYERNGAKRLDQYFYRLELS